MDLLRNYFDPVLVVACGLALLLSSTQILPTSVTTILLVIINLLGIIPVVLSAVRALRSRKISVDLLASIALIFSLIAGELSSAVFINLMLSFARIFSKYTEGSIRRALESLLELRPQTARVFRQGDFVEVNISELVKGDIVMTKLGERIAVDGEIVQGSGSIDQSSFTGESIPVERKTGDKVLTSTLLVAGELQVRAEKVGGDTAFARVVRLVDDAQKNKSRIDGLGQRFASIYVITILVISIVLFFAGHSLSLVLSVLLVVCADDIAVAIPLAFTAAMSMLAKRGILVKGGIYLENLGKLKTLLFDKTGTLTTGKLRVKSLMILDDEFETSQVIQMAGSLADFSTHPVSKAIHQYMHDSRLKIETVIGFKEISGSGLEGEISGMHLILGSLKFMESVNVGVDKAAESQINELVKQGDNLTFVSINKSLVGVFTIADEVKVEARSAISRLHGLGVDEIIMLTGDNEQVAGSVAGQVGITKFEANLLPEDKLNFVQRKIAKAGVVGMVGDGVNDAPVLNLATVGIAMGAIGSDVAVQSADVVLMRDDLLEIPYAVKVGRRVNMISKQNFVLWVIMNAVGLVLVFNGTFTPASAAAYNFVTDIFTILNAMRAMRPIR
ncbi:MAG: cation-translocating P-type ATPase [Candidatus Doudnabacteria bacterium]|nr:cation-translocating P-type ATPase [Candidatus Doudnabacteria bacterium]